MTSFETRRSLAKARDARRKAELALVRATVSVEIMIIHELPVSATKLREITCYIKTDPLPPDPDSEDVRKYTVLSPPTFYEASRYGLSYTYQSKNDRTIASPYEVHKMHPSYEEGDELMCIKVKGVWYDMSTDGRQWVRVG